MENTCEKALVKVRLITSEKYGVNQKGVFICENVTKGTKLWSRMTQDKSIFTREELEQLKISRPELSENIDSFSCQSGHDIFTIPTSCLIEGEDIDFRQYVNHSCSPNCGYFSEKGETFTIAITDIRAGEELSIHYGMLETEISFTYGLECKCGSKNCQKFWEFDLYRTDSDLLKYAKPELINQIKEMKTDFWFSKKCCLKRINEAHVPIKERQLVLVCRKDIQKNEYVARFIDDQHVHLYPYVVGNAAPNCLLDGEHIVSSRYICEGERIIIN